MGIRVLRHKCKQCGACCKWEGIIRITGAELKILSAFLNILEEKFVAEYVDPFVGTIHNLKLKSNGECIFLNDNKCTVYPARPSQCRAFPFEWHVKDVEKLCPGVEEFEKTQELM
jgi:Fe-S-cluster containining protein